MLFLLYEFFCIHLLLRVTCVNGEKYKASFRTTAYDKSMLHRVCRDITVVLYFNDLYFNVA